MNYTELKEIAKTKNILVKDLATETGITRQGLQKVLDNDTIELRKVKRICEILQIHPTMFFENTTVKGLTVGNTKSKDTEISLLRDQINDKNEIIKMLREKINGYENLSVAATPKTNYKK
jgi:DNA-binding Xre family transcriptional regulator